MLELWQRGYTTPSVMINVHPELERLPQDVKIVLVQGSKEEVWPLPRGYDEHGRLRPGRTLEALIRTGSPRLCYLYHTIEKAGLRTRAMAIRTSRRRCCSTTACLG